MPFDLNEYLVNKSVKEVELPLEYCQVCGKNGLQPDCNDHSSALEKSVTLKIQSISWSERNQIMTNSVRWDSEGNTRFDGDSYTKECLKKVIVEAPWGQTNEMFLIRVGGVLGEALETLIPKAFSQSKAPSIEDVKKEQSSS